MRTDKEGLWGGGRGKKGWMEKRKSEGERGEREGEASEREVKKTLLARVSSLRVLFVPSGSLPLRWRPMGRRFVPPPVGPRDPAKKSVPGAWPDPDSPRRHAHAIESPADLRSDAPHTSSCSAVLWVGVLSNSCAKTDAKTLLSAPTRKSNNANSNPNTNAKDERQYKPLCATSTIAHSTAQTARSTPHAAHRTPQSFPCNATGAGGQNGHYNWREWGAATVKGDGVAKWFRAWWHARERMYIQSATPSPVPYIHTWSVSSSVRRMVIQVEVGQSKHFGNSMKKTL